MPESTNESDWEKCELGWKIPRYLRTRTLKIKKHHNGSLYIYCDCKCFNQFGILCHHSCAVLGNIRLEHFHLRNLQQYVAHYKRPNYDEVTKLLKSMVEANVPGPVLAKADLGHIETAFGMRYPSFHGHKSTRNLEFYMKIKNAWKPVLAHETEAEPAKMTGDDGDIVSFIHDYQCTGMFSQEEVSRRKSSKVL
jgi:hypothetical protein